MLRRMPVSDLNTSDLVPVTGFAETIAAYKTVKSFFYAHSIGGQNKQHFKAGIGAFLSDT
jgi:hypothetical protein